ncbi:MAG TPA: HepT-like ribonuclease domain-containing protein [Dehalococcoidia bacterium]|nr:HepT-like ribonuclease domain-containing protein [Dehalococcoidia bacterium]
MQVEAQKYLYDIQRASELLATFTAGKGFSDYQEDAMLRAATERQFEVIGEALGQLARLDSELAGRISEHQRIIAFRNILIHGYADIDDRLVWDIVETRLPRLRDEVTALLAEP